ncbi:MAG TPA: serine hydrolase [Gemmatimonadaceae bacterium]|jgi:CubicO group peptidase (beta-lactamase class C family)|nr:serine hydrolase [Gemmatimonadaceae bacterium]
MVFRVVLLALAAGAVVAPPPMHAQGGSLGAPSATRAFPADSVVRSIIKQRVDDKRSAGIVVGMLDDDGRTRVVAYGDPGPGQPPLDANSVFEIGSISKVFTATVLAELVKEGRVHLEDPIDKFLPASVHVPERNGLKITLGTLSEQNSGLPRMPNNFRPKDPKNPYVDYGVPQLYDFVSHYTLTRDPGAQFEYSNLGVGLLGHVLTLITSQSYEEMERERVWKPLDMRNTGVVLTPWMKAHLALGHDEQGAVTSNWDLDALAGAGAIRSTTNDMLKFAAANVHPERGPLGPTMAFAQQERAPAGGPQQKIGLNWLSIHTAFGDTIVWHNGGTGGYRTFIGLAPSRHMAVVVMSNSGGEGADDIGMHLLDRGIPLQPKPIPPKKRTAIAVGRDVLQRYVGTYQLGPQLVLEVTLADSVLQVRPTGQNVADLFAESETDFFFKVVDAQITFTRDAQGTVTGLVLHQNGADLAAKRIR